MSSSTAKRPGPTVDFGSWVIPEEVRTRLATSELRPSSLTGTTMAIPVLSPTVIAAARESAFDVLIATGHAKRCPLHADVLLRGEGAGGDPMEHAFQHRDRLARPLELVCAFVASTRPVEACPYCAGGDHDR